MVCGFAIFARTTSIAALTICSQHAVRLDNGGVWCGVVQNKDGVCILSQFNSIQFKWVVKRYEFGDGSVGCEIQFQRFSKKKFNSRVPIPN